MVITFTSLGEVKKTSMNDQEALDRVMAKVLLGRVVDLDLILYLTQFQCNYTSVTPMYWPENLRRSLMVMYYFPR